MGLTSCPLFPDKQSEVPTNMAQYIQNVVFDNSYQDPYHANDDIVGYEVRKKSIAGNIWECLTGKKQKADIYLFEDPPAQELILYEDRPRRDLVYCGQEHYNDNLAFVPWRARQPPPLLRRYHSEYREESVECTGCAVCWQHPDLGRYHRPFPRLLRRSWRYHSHEHSHSHHRYNHSHGSGWGAAPFWDPEWVPRRWRRRLSRRARAERRHDEHPGQTLQRELVKLMNQRLREMRHERIYDEWPRSSTLDSRGRRNDRIDEIDEQLVDLERMQYEAYFGSDDGSTDYDFSDSDD